MNDIPKVIAFHLPQFHTFPENDEWWGKGFTEWVNVKKAKPLFKEHNQPRIPYDDNYYDLSEYKTREWQAKTAKEYGVYGFCYYHYYFDGKLLMEKPIEALLKEKSIDFPFCLCWANEPWTRAWDGCAREVIMPQNYGDEDSWIKHINYLLPFFQDDRYIKVDGAPMFVIYRTTNIDRCEEMIDCWDKVCKAHGLSGIYIVEENNAFQTGRCCKNSKAILDFEPNHIRTVCRKKGVLRLLDIFDNHIVNRITFRKYYVFDYDLYWKKIIKLGKNTEGSESVKHYLGGFVDWDNTPRRAVNGLVCRNVSVEKFSKYMTQLLRVSKNNNSEFVFVNAWNEWAEGAYLEPDKKNGYGYLEAIKGAINNLSKQG